MDTNDLGRPCQRPLVFLDLNLFEGTENPLKLFGIYDDVYQKVDAQWLIARTHIDFIWPRREYKGLRDLA